MQSPAKCMQGTLAFCKPTPQNKSVFSQSKNHLISVAKAKSQQLDSILFFLQVFMSKAERQCGFNLRTPTFFCEITVWFHVWEEQSQHKYVPGGWCTGGRSIPVPSQTLASGSSVHEIPLRDPTALRQLTGRQSHRLSWKAPVANVYKKEDSNTINEYCASIKIVSSRALHEACLSLLCVYLQLAQSSNTHFKQINNDIWMLLRVKDLRHTCTSFTN